MEARLIPVHTMRPLGTDSHAGLVRFAATLPAGCVMAEIGSYAGESAKVFLDSGRVAVLFCIDPWLAGYDAGDIASESDMRAVEDAFDERLGDENGHAGRGCRYVKVKQSSADAAKDIPDGVFDMVYIDGCHQREAVKQDIAAWRSKVRAGGWIAGHDFSGDVALAVIESFGRPPDETYADSSWRYTV